MKKDKKQYFLPKKPEPTRKSGEIQGKTGENLETDYFFLQNFRKRKKPVLPY
jgi:hypothetical protein